MQELEQDQTNNFSFLLRALERYLWTPGLTVCRPLEQYPLRDEARDLLRFLQLLADLSDPRVAMRPLTTNVLSPQAFP